MLQQGFRISDRLAATGRFASFKVGGWHFRDSKLMVATDCERHSRCFLAFDMQRVSGLSSLWLLATIRGLGFEELASEGAVVYLIKDHSQQQGTEMVYQPLLNLIVRNKAEDTAVRQCFSHIDPDGCGPNSAAHQAGYDLRDGSDLRANSSESIGGRHQNRLSAAQAAVIVFESWLGSPGHRRHVLAQADSFRHQTADGFGYAYSAKGPFGWSSHSFVLVTANHGPDAGVRPFIEWKFSNFSLAEMDASRGDLDGDGRDLLWEYALGSDLRGFDKGK